MSGLLLERGADVNWRAKNGLTALHLSAQEDAVPVATILVQNGAQIDPKTKVQDRAQRRLAQSWLYLYRWQTFVSICKQNVF